MEVSDAAFVVSGLLEIRASAVDAYDLVCDITRMGEWSPECVGGEWAVRAHPGGRVAVGDRFRGRNRSGSREWTTDCEVIVADRPREFAWDVLSLAPAPRTSVWRFLVAETASGVLLEERFEMSAPPQGLGFLLEQVAPERRGAWLEARQRSLREGIRSTLSALQHALEEQAP